MFFPNVEHQSTASVGYTVTQYPKALHRYIMIKVKMLFHYLFLLSLYPILPPVGNQTCNDNFTLGRGTTPMLTPYSHKQAARRAVHMAVGRVNIGVVPRPNVNRRYRSDSLLAVDR